MGRQVRDGLADFGIVLGGSGQGEQIAANKVRGVRAALCNDVYLATMARSHKRQCVVDGWAVVSFELGEEILRVFLTTPFEVWSTRAAGRATDRNSYEGPADALAIGNTPRRCRVRLD